jgi:hypothetical protein
MDLSLIFAIDLVKQVEAQDLFTDGDLVAILENLAGNALAVYKDTVSRAEIRQNILDLTVFIQHLVDLRVTTGDLCIVHANIGLKSPPQDDLFTLERYRNSDQLAAQKNERRPKIAFNTFGFYHRDAGVRRGVGLR